MSAPTDEATPLATSKEDNSPSFVSPEEMELTSTSILTILDNKESLDNTVVYEDPLFMEQEKSPNNSFEMKDLNENASDNLVALDDPLLLEQKQLIINPSLEIKELSLIGSDNSIALEDPLSLEQEKSSVNQQMEIIIPLTSDNETEVESTNEMKPTIKIEITDLSDCSNVLDTPTSSYIENPTDQMTQSEESQKSPPPKKRKSSEKSENLTPKRMRRYCSVFGCMISTLSNPELAFFTLPPDKDRRARWLKLMSREDLLGKSSQYCLCESHFQAGDILVSANRKVLKKNTLPALNLPNVLMEDKGIQAQATKSNILIQTLRRLSDTYTQTTKALYADSARIQKLQTQITESKKQLRSLKRGKTSEKSQKESFHRLCDKFLSKQLADLIKAQTNLKCHHRGNRYTIAYKIFCLNLYHVSPQAYRLLEKAFFLPCRTTLNKLYVPVSTDVNDDLMSTLKVKVDNMSELEKNCAVIVDSMSLKCSLYYDIKKDKIIGFHEVDGVQSPIPAKNALVVIIQGLFINWMQPVGFALLSDSKSNDENIIKWIDKILLKLLDIGLKIRAFVSDVASGLANMPEKKFISVERPFFFLCNTKVYYIFDCPQLLRLLRDNFMKYHFYSHSHAAAKFDYVKQFYEHDKTKNFRLAEKITSNHMNPKKSQKMKTTYATDLFCKSVAAGISTYIDFNMIDVSARDTVKLILMINDLMNALNSSIECGEESQVTFLYNMLNFFHSLKLINPKNGNDITESVKFIQGFQITIMGILLLMEELKQEGHKRLITSRLSQDVANTFFDKIRSKDCIGNKPTSRQFFPAFRRLFFSNLLKSPKGGRADDASKFFLKLNEFHNSESSLDENVVHPEKVQVNELQEITCSDYSKFEIPSENALYNISEFLFSKCVQRHKDCETITSYAESEDKAENFHVFVSYVERMETIFRNCFNAEYINVKIGSLIYEQIKTISLTPPCTCFPLNYLQKLFVRMRIFMAIKNNNNDFRKHPIKKEKIFSVINF